MPMQLATSRQFFFIELPVLSKGSERSYICLLGVSMLPLFTIFLLDFGTFSTVCVLFFSIFHFITILVISKTRLVH